MNNFITFPNILSCLRLISAPLCTWLLCQQGERLWWGVVLFSVAAISDLFDGYWARRFAAGSQWGAFLDPLADKALILSALASFVWRGMVPWAVVALFILRDVVVTVLRVHGMRGGAPLVTSWLAKCKTVLQIASLYAGFVVVLVPCDATIHVCASWLIFYMLMLGSIVLTVYTGALYVHAYVRSLPKLARILRQAQDERRVGGNHLRCFLIRFFVMVGGIGYVPWAPGTLASIAGMVFSWWLFSWARIAWWVFVLGAGSLFFCAVQAINYFLAHDAQAADKKDPSCVVIDEFFAVLMLAYCIPHDGGFYAVALMFFRFFDIVKPFPIRQLERAVPGGLGVMIDDVAAALCSFVWMWVAFKIIAP